MKGNLKNWILVVVIILVLALPIIIGYFSNHSIGEVTLKEFNEAVANGENYVVYYGSTSDDEKKEEVEKVLDTVTDEFDSNVKVAELIVEDSEIAEFEKTNENLSLKDNYIIANSGKVMYVTNKDELSGVSKLLSKLLNKYINFIIPEDEVAYKTVSTYDQYMKVVDSKNITMTVFGRNTCGWCNRFKPVYNEAASKYKLNIYFIDSDSFDKKEYAKILKSSKLYVPAECTDDNKQVPLTEGFGTPLTLFTKKGKIVGYICGYKDSEGLLAKLKEVGMVK